MKYYKVDLARFHNTGRVPSYASGDEVKDGEEYFDLISEGQLLESPPVFDSFFLKSFDRKKYWEWILCDIYDFTGEGSQMNGDAFLVSSALKEILVSLFLPYEHRYYSSVLRYKREKLERYIFHYSGDEIWENKFVNVDFTKTTVLIPEEGEVCFNVKSFDEFRACRNKTMEEKKLENRPSFSTLVLKRDIDFFPLESIGAGIVASERFRERVESAGLVGFEFSELDYKVEVL